MKRVLVALVLVGCSQTSSTTPPVETPDAAQELPDAAVETPDAAMPVTTSLAIAMAGHTGMLTRAQLGVTRSDGGVSALYIEAYAGGDPACPDQNSPTPDYTLIIANIPPDDAEVTTEEGLRVTLLDFTGDILPGPAPARATSATLSVQTVETSGEPFLEGSLSATFDEGTITGTLRATHCASLDD